MDRSILISPAAKNLAAIVVVLTVLAWILWPTKLPAPLESNRVWHPDGYSVIMPPGWQMSFVTAQTTLAPKSNRGLLRIEPMEQGYFPPSLEVLRLVGSPGPDQIKPERFSPGTFHGLPAQIGRYRDGKQWVYRVIFQDRGTWFDINLSTPDYENCPRSPYWPYIDSFQFTPENAKDSDRNNPATQMHFTTMPARLPK